MTNRKLFKVEKIIDSKQIGPKKYYLVKWDGYPQNQSTWEPTSNLQAVRNLIKDFEINAGEIEI